MNRPHVKTGCAAPAGMGTLLLLVGLLIGGCLPPTPIVPIPDPVNPVVVPLPTSGVRVLIVEETSRRDRLLPEQVDVFTSAVFRKTLIDSKVELRIWDEDVDAENESDATFKAMLQQPRTSLPWLVISGKPGFSGPLPKTMDETLALIARQK